MNDLLAARIQMAVSLGFHILFAVAGIAMPVLMVVSEWRFLRTGDAAYRELNRRWARGTAVLFAVGAVSGTVLSFELGLLWPTFMSHAGPLVGMPFSLEGFAFFLEAIALGIYLYGWDRVPKAVHFASGLVVAVAGATSAVFVTAANAWMNTPRGFRVDGSGQFVDIDLGRAFFTPALPFQATHMVIAAYASIGFAVLGIHAARLRRDPKSQFHAAALRIVLPMVCLMAPLQIVSGDLSAKHLGAVQPTKLAAAESLFQSTRGAPLLIGGWPDVEAGQVRGAIALPKVLSVLAKGDPEAWVQGLQATPRSEWPPVAWVHACFQTMVACGFAMLLIAAWGGWLWGKKAPLGEQPRFLRAATWTAPLGLIAVEAGWGVTELGRQPWAIQGVLKVEDAVTPMPYLVVPLAVTVGIYLLLGIVVGTLLWREVLSVRESLAEAGEP
jgi:cytochrome d ubiquinol oxidase subunit I